MRFKHNTTGWALHAAGGAVLLVVVGVSYGFGFSRFADQHEEHSDRTKQLSALLRTAPEVHIQHQRQQEEFEQLKQQTTAMRGRLPSLLGKEEFESSTKKIASTVGLFIKNTNWSDSIQGSSHSSAEFKISGNGSYASICKFLNEINQLARITKVSSLRLGSGQDSAQYPVDITFVLVYGVNSHDTEEKGGTL